MCFWVQSAKDWQQEGQGTFREDPGFEQSWGHQRHSNLRVCRVSRMNLLESCGYVFMICVYMFVAFMECEWMWRVAECDYMDDSLERLCTPKRTIHLCQGGSISPFFVNHRESCACLESIPFGAILQAYWGYTILKTSLSPKMVVVLATTGRKAINFYKFQRMSQGTEARWFNFYIGIFIFAQGNLCHEGLQTGSSHSTYSMIKYDKVW